MANEPTVDDAFAAVCESYAAFTTDDPVGKQQLAACNQGLRDAYAARPRRLTDAAAFFFDRFTTAELDSTTPNARGMGRMTDHIPRFAAKHREPFASMSHDQLTELRYAIKRHVICAYLYLEFIYQLAAVDESRYDNARLFDQWVSLIYLPPRELDPQSKDQADIQGISFGATGRKIRDIATTASINWDTRDTIGSDQAIVTHYFDAGTTLRYTEARLGA